MSGVADRRLLQVEVKGVPLQYHEAMLAAVFALRVLSFDPDDKSSVLNLGLGASIYLHRTIPNVSIQSKPL